uniref:Uncharacterized protein n=1 Tax=Ditylenchus dipsaci TaxID=166011 RepID=A0A915DXN9_9BILA
MEITISYLLDSHASSELLNHDSSFVLYQVWCSSLFILFFSIPDGALNLEEIVWEVSVVEENTNYFSNSEPVEEEMEERVVTP